MKFRHKSWWKNTSKVVASIGAINWGLIAINGYNLVEAIFGAVPNLVIGAYTVIAVSGVIVLADTFGFFK